MTAPLSSYIKMNGERRQNQGKGKESTVLGNGIKVFLLLVVS